MEQPKNPVPQWLQNLQDNSWEIELLISGGAVFTLLQFPDLFVNFIRTMRITSSIPGWIVYLILGMGCIKILTNGFILHLLLRSFWLAMVCLNYIFPQGIEGKKMKRAFPFRSRHVEGDLREQIMQVDRISGLVIFMTILSTIVITGFVVVLTVLINTEDILSNRINLGWIGDLIIESFQYGVILYFSDLLLMGIFRRIPVLSWILYPFFTVFDFLSLRKLYERPLALFSSNIRKPQFIVGSLIFAVITGITTYIPLTRPMHWPRLFDSREYRDQLSADDQTLVYRYYADQCESEHLGVVSIPSHLIENNLLQVNLIYDKWMDNLLDHSEADRSKRFLSNLIELSINDSIYQTVSWLEIRKEEENQLGLVSMVDISHLPNGAHKLKIQSKNLPDKEYQKIRSSLLYKVTIPFWKDVH